jgi:hypothetical protein
MKLVKDDALIKMMDDTAKEYADIVDSVIQEIIEPLKIVANPEQLIGKPYAMWTPQDRQMLQTIYASNLDKLDKFILNKDLQETVAIEKQLGE